MATQQQIALTQAAHPLLPKPLAKPGFVRWLKKLHAWIGIVSVVAAIIFAYSGFVLNHRTDMRIGAENVVTEWTLPVPASGFASAQAMADFVAAELDLKSTPTLTEPGQGGGRRAAGGSGQFTASFQAASVDVAAVYELGAEAVQITRTERPFTRLSTRLHAGRGTGELWHSIISIYSVMLIFLSLTGLLMWSRLSGSRLVGGSLIGVTVVAMIWFVMGGP